MSEENVEIVRERLGAVNAFMRGELTSEALAELLNPQTELDCMSSERTLTPHSIFGAPQRSSGSGSKLEAGGMA